MYNYLVADGKRLVRRFPRWLLLLLALGAMAVFVAFMAQSGMYGRWSSFTYTAAVKALLKPLSLIIGLIEIIFIFGDDLKAKTMQASIGGGVPRSGVVAGKFIETCLFSLLDVVIYGLLTIVVGYMFKAGLSGAQIKELSAYFIVEWLRVIGYTSLTMILLFFTRSLALSVVLYIALYSKVIDMIVGTVITLGPMKSMHLDRYTMSTLLDTLQTYLIGGLPALKPLLGVLAYVVFGCLASMLVFRKRELNL